MSTAIPRVLILHAYSAENAGDGLLVTESLELLGAALGECNVTLLASRPDSFADVAGTVLPTVPTRRGWDRRTRAVLKQIDSYDLVLGVGGGYLRAGTPVETIKSVLVQGPQLLAAARTSAPTIYLPQSVGPARFGLRRRLRKLLGGVDIVMLRDDRSVDQFRGPTTRRAPDLATAAVVAGRSGDDTVSSVPVLSIRSVHGRINPDIYRLADAIAPYDSYIQSTVGGNDDRPATSTLTPQRVIERDELMTPDSQRRVVVAVRLHAALMALAAGHYVIHLAYERKGFGAFSDLGIAPWVHSVNSFDVRDVSAQVDALLNDATVRADYDRRISDARGRVEEERRRTIADIRALAGRTSDGH